MTSPKSIHLYLRSAHGWNGLIRYEHLEDAVETCRRYEDESTRQREGIQSCWIIDATTSQLILGRKPAGWSPNDPVYENDTSQQ